LREGLKGTAHNFGEFQPQGGMLGSSHQLCATFPLISFFCPQKNLEVQPAAIFFGWLLKPKLLLGPMPPKQRMTRMFDNNNNGKSLFYM